MVNKECLSPKKEEVLFFKVLKMHETTWKCPINSTDSIGVIIFFIIKLLFV